MFSCNLCFLMPFQENTKTTFPAIMVFHCLSRKKLCRFFLQSLSFTSVCRKTPDDISCNHGFHCYLQENPRATFPAIMVFHCLSRKMPRRFFLQSLHFTSSCRRTPDDISCNHGFHCYLQENPRATFPAIMVFHCLSRKKLWRFFLQSLHFTSSCRKTPDDISCNHGFHCYLQENPRATFPAIMLF